MSGTIRLRLQCSILQKDTNKIKDIAGQVLLSYEVSSETTNGGALKEKLLLEISHNLQENICVRVSFLNKVAGAISGPVTPSRRGCWDDLPPSRFFWVAKMKKKRQSKKRKSFKAKTIKKLSPWSKCYFFNHSRAYIIKPTIMADNTCQCPMAPPLWNPFRRPLVCNFIKKETLAQVFSS